jgi:hypothetical protein
VGRMLKMATLVAVMLSLGGATAQASSGTITRAVATPDWTRGSFAGSFTWDGCVADPQAPCDWTPIATVAPSAPGHACLGDEASDSDPNTQVVWSGARQTANGTAMVDQADVAILPGVRGQRLCFSVVYIPTYRDPSCVAQAPDPTTCPYTTQPRGLHLAEALFTTPATEGEAPYVPPPIITTPPPPAPPPAASAPLLTKATASASARRALAKRYGRAYRRATRKRLTCGRTSRTVQRCTFSFRYRKRYRGVVTVRSTPSGIKTSVRSR